MRNSSALMVVALTCALGCRVARPPAEPATRILDLERELKVVVVSDPPGVAVYQAAPGAEPREIGRTPLVIDRLWVTKEMWKHGAPRPPPSGAAFELERDARGVERQTGEELVWTLLVRDRKGPFRELVFRLSPADLAESYSLGRIELTVPAAARPR